MGGIHSALGNPDVSLSYYNLAGQRLETLPEEETTPPERAEWKGVLTLKLAQHHLRMEKYKETQ